MVVASFIFGIVIFLDLNIFLYADQKYCTFKNTFNNECMYKCHCVNNAPCSQTNGSCGNQSLCSPGWIGPGCQYSNLAFTSRVIYDNNDLFDKVRDGNYRTCHRASTFKIDLQRSYHISSFTVFTNDDSTKVVLRASVTNSTIDNEDHANTCVVSTSMSRQRDFICTHTIFGRYVILTFQNDACICEIGIHGGRNIALWKTTNQSTTLSPYSADKAVDGDDGNYEISLNSCTHTSGDNSTIKPYWEVLFKQLYVVQRLVIYFRDENLLQRASNYFIKIFNNNNEIKTIQTNGKPMKKEEIVLSKPVPVTALTIGLPIYPSPDNVLSLCEVNVFACRLGTDGEVCTDSCPDNCYSKEKQNYCPDFICPQSSCKDKWHGKYCTKKECSINNLATENLKTDVLSCSPSPCLSGQSINVQCVPGFTLNGSDLIVCGEDGNWSNATSCKANTCMLPDDKHTNSNVTGIADVRFGTTVKITCVKGYHLKAPTVIHCQLNGTWSYKGIKTAPVCQVNTCSLPKTDDHTHTSITTVEEKISFGTSIEISCDPGYRLKVPTVVICQLDGTWNYNFDNSSTICEEDMCLVPDDSTLARTIRNQRIKLNTHLSISCHPGYKPGHLKQIYCNSNGTWDNQLNGSITLSGEVLSSKPDENHLSGVGLGVGIGIAVFIIILLIVGITLFIRRKRKQNDKTEKNRRSQANDVNDKDAYCSIEETENESETTLTIDNNASEQSGYYSFLPNKGITKNAIKIEHFKDYVEENKGNDGSIVRQFSNLLTGLQYSAKVACFQQNKAKNKYKNIYAYDSTRVVLHRSKEKSDYINASYINGYDSVKRYVASQGPIKGTEEDFWEMVYQLGCNKIVMLTNVYEEGKQKCVQYWPDEGCITFGSMTVQLKSVDRYADFTIRHLSINEDGKERRKVRQFHFTSWPDKGVPKYASSLVQFRHKVLSVPTKGKGPLVVHCSAGIGRTGAFMALDILVSQARATGQVDVLACVETLRRQRVNMVQTAEQYLFLHHALEEALMCKTTATAAADFPEIYSRLQQKVKLQRGIVKEFQTLNETSPVLQEKEFVSGKTTENKRKNRYSNILPVESHRIYIYSYIPGRSDYINAVMLPSYKESKAFIATQMPLPDTVVDFLCLVHDNDVSSIVMLNEMNDGATLGRYWPDNEDELKVGPFTVTKSSEEIIENVVIRQLKIQFESKETRIIKQFQVKFWPDCDVIPSSVSDVLTLMELVQNWQRKTEGYTPVVVHCMNGCDKTGLYCVVEATIERLKIEQDVGIQQIIKQMRSRRPQIIPCIEQFEFCHEAVLEFMHQNETYSNFQ